MTMAKFTREARRAPRARHDSTLELLADGGSAPAGSARLVDVSSSGARFAATETFVVGAPIRARLRLLKSGVLDVRGTVVRVEEKTNYTLYAVRFDSTSARG
ncbi:MAG: PilZ domain-containing protein [Elusimicrobia bacterium]|nr:PilZ domain-containing protein [Elusimicrobiota bacterium]